jgi:uncharacterized membrane protein
VQVFVIEGMLLPVFAFLYLRSPLRGRFDNQRTSLARRVARIALPGMIAYVSYMLILYAYRAGGEVAAVTAVRQASIPISVVLAGVFLREGTIARRLAASLILSAGIVVIVTGN